jgi:peroxiredoxin family protein
MGKTVVGLASFSTEKLLVAVTVIGGAVALGMEVDMYLLLGGARAFRRDLQYAASYEQPQLSRELLSGMKRAGVMNPFTSLEELKRDGGLRIHVCATAGKIWGAPHKENFSDLVDDVVGVAEYVSRCAEADVVQVI